MSGCETEGDNLDFEKDFIQKFPQVAESCAVASDTYGSFLTASQKGGLVLIAGTGSNALLINPDGSTARCGGWGHFLADEGSAIWISLTAVKTVFNSEDNFVSCPYDVSKVKQLILEHFKVPDKFGLLKHCYVNFNKSYFAGLCAKLAKAAEVDQDQLCLHLFKEAGQVLAKTVIALIPKVQKDLKEADGGLPIICVGSVFRSWNLLSEGFKKGMDSQLQEYSLISLNCSSAIGAAYLGAKKCNFELPLDYRKNTSLLYHHKDTSPLS